MFALDDAEIRKGRLMLQPGGAGERAFADLMRRAAVANDLATLGRPITPALARLAMALPHDPNCVALSLQQAIAGNRELAELR